MKILETLPEVYEIPLIIPAPVRFEIILPLITLPLPPFPPPFADATPMIVPVPPVMLLIVLFVMVWFTLPVSAALIPLTTVAPVTVIFEKLLAFQIDVVTLLETPEVVIPETIPPAPPLLKAVKYYYY